MGALGTDAVAEGVAAAEDATIALSSIAGAISILALDSPLPSRVGADIAEASTLGAIAASSALDA